MGRRERDKGLRAEREIVHLHRALGVPAERVPLSGAAGGSYAGDLVVAGRYTAEVKSRAGGAGFRTVNQWLGTHALLFLRRDRARPLVVLQWDVYVDLIRGQAGCPRCGTQENRDE